MEPDTSVSMCRSDRLHVVTREDRLAEFSGLKLLLASLRHKCPDIRVSAYLKSDHIAVEGEHLRSIHPEVQLVPMDDAIGWACKPAVLLRALASESRDDAMVMWVDTDIIAMRDFSELADTPSDLVLSAEESNPNPNDELSRRQELLGLPVGSPRQSTISSAVIGVRRSHRGLLEAWQRGVETPQFKDQQRLPEDARLLFGDQEVWEAVLCTTEFQEIPVRLLRNFNEMLQATYTSYVTKSQMQREVAPFFLHATGNLKPWRKSRMRFAQEVFPYFDRAQTYLGSLADDQALPFRSSSIAARIFKRVAGFDLYTHLRRAHHRIKHR